MVTSLTGWIGNASYVGLSMVVTIYNGNVDIINWMDWQCQLHWSKYGGHNLQWEW